MYTTYLRVQDSARTDVMCTDSQLRPFVLVSAFWCFFSFNRSTKYDTGLDEGNTAIFQLIMVRKKYKFITAIYHSLNFELWEGQQNASMAWASTSTPGCQSLLGNPSQDDTSGNDTNQSPINITSSVTLFPETASFCSHISRNKTRYVYRGMQER